MYTDIFGNKRIRLGLHHHTTLSDGRLTPEEMVARYKAAGYDALALTDHWYYGEAREIDGMPILPGCEYHTGTETAIDGIFHIVCLCADQEPQLERSMTPQQIIDGIHAAGGLAVLAHPAWSLDTPEMIRRLHGFDATEIYNTVSGRGNSRRADSSLLVDMLATQGCFFPLLATDDSHFYEPSGNFADSCTSFIMARCDSPEPEQVKAAIVRGDFYASTGPEIHLSVMDGIARVDCSEVCEIAFMSNLVYANNRAFTGENLTSAEYTLHPNETYIRAYVTDATGRQAWTNCVRL